MHINARKILFVTEIMLFASCGCTIESILNGGGGVGGGGAMLFHACWVIYTVKELGSHGKHGQKPI